MVTTKTPNRDTWKDLVVEILRAVSGSFDPISMVHRLQILPDLVEPAMAAKWNSDFKLSWEHAKWLAKLMDLPLENKPLPVFDEYVSKLPLDLQSKARIQFMNQSGPDSINKLIAFLTLKASTEPARKEKRPQMVPLRSAAVKQEDPGRPDQNRRKRRRESSDGEDTTGMRSMGTNGGNVDDDASVSSCKRRDCCNKGLLKNCPIFIKGGGCFLCKGAHYKMHCPQLPPKSGNE